MCGFQIKDKYFEPINVRPTDWTVCSESLLLGLDKEDFNKANYMLSSTD